MSQAVEKILVRGVNWLGDAVMTTPALQRLREARPRAHITLLTPDKLAALWPAHPSLDAVLTFSAGESVFSLGRRLRAEGFAEAVVFPNSVRSALEVFLARIPRRVGYARNGRALLLTEALPPRGGAVKMHKRSRTEIGQRIQNGGERETFPARAHHVHDYLQLVVSLGGDSAPLPPLLQVPAAEVLAARARFLPSVQAPCFALNAGAEYGPAKRWPAARFVAAAAELHAATSCHWIIVGGSGDLALAESITSELRAKIGESNITNVAGRTSLRELCALFRSCTILLTNDTGPMHVAAALGTPVVVPFGSTAPELTGPASSGPVAHHILLGEAPCAPCFLRECPVDFRCLNSIPIDRVVNAALAVWRSRGGREA